MSSIRSSLEHASHFNLPSLSAALGALGLDSGSRLYQLEIDAPDLISGPLALESFCGHEALSTLFRHEVIALSDQAELDLHALIGRPLCIRQRLADGSLSRRSGQIIAARSLGQDGALTRYQFSIAPWAHALTQRRDSRVFQEQSVLQIIETVFSAYAPLAAWRLADGVESFMRDAPVRSYCVQYRETDYAFVSRLLAEEGLGFCFVEAQEEAEGKAGSEQAGHEWLIFADTATLPEDYSNAQGRLRPDGAGIRFHRAASQESHDAVTALGAQRVLQASVCAALSWDYKRKQVIAQQLEGSLGHHNDALPALIAHDIPGAYAFADEAGALRALRITREAVEARNKQFLGAGSVRSFRAGHRFVLADSPLLAHGEATQAQAAHFLLTAVLHAGLNNLPRPAQEAARHLDQALAALLGVCADTEAATGFATEVATDVAHGPTPPRWLQDNTVSALLAQARERGYANAFGAQRVQVPWRAVLLDETGRRLNTRPTAPGVQTATVTGPEGETTPGASGEIHTDALHRVRVQFPPASE